MIDQNDLKPRRIEKVALARNAAIESMLIEDPILIYLIAQDAVEEITDMPVGRELGYVHIGRLFTRRGHHGADGCIPGLGSENLGEVLEETEAIDNTVGFALFVHDRCDPTRTAGKCPGHPQLRIWAEAVETLHHRLKPGRGICQENRCFKPQLL